MEIEILHLKEGASKARGLCVIIDVFRAFSTACYVMDQGATKIIPVADVERAYELKRTNPGFILMGERNNRKLPGFEYGNSPTHIQKVDFRNKTVIQTTSAGTQGIENAPNASEIITGSFVNAGSIARYISENNPEHVSLVCMGNAALYPAEEDGLCAEYLRALLTGKRMDFNKIRKRLRLGAGLRLFNPANELHSPPSDFDLCLDLDRFGFVLRAEKLNGEYYLLKTEIQ